MLKNSEYIEEFKKSLSATVKSIGKNQKIEINFVKENPSVNGDIINLTEPNIENIKNNLNYLRAEADSLALEFRLHSREIHQNFMDNDELSNEILNALEQTRIEVMGSQEFKGIGNNLKVKHYQDLSRTSQQKSKDELIQAFRYVSYEELIGQNLGNDNEKFKTIIKEKLKNNYSSFFKELKNNINDQEKFSSTIIEKLEELGLLNKNNNNSQENEDNENEIDDNEQNKENDKQNNEESSEANIEMQSSEVNIEQSLSTEQNEEMGDDSSDTELEYYPKIESLDKLEIYKIYNQSFDEIINAEELCDLK